MFSRKLITPVGTWGSITLGTLGADIEPTVQCSLSRSNRAEVVIHGFPSGIA